MKFSKRKSAPMVLLGMALFASPNLQAADTVKKSRPNVLMIAMDDFNHWATHLGRNPQAATPNIDRLAARGVAFKYAYAAVPACEPSRGALMSGMRPWTTGLYYNGDKWKELIPEGSGLSAQFKKAGYHVAGAGKIYHNNMYYPSEWTEYMDGTGLSDHGKGVMKNEGFHAPVGHDLKDEDLSDWHVVNWCIKQIQEKRDKPFFVACGLHKPHLPFVVPRKYYDKFPLESIQLPPFLENDLDDIPPAGVRMAKPETDHARMMKSGRWKDAIRSYLAACSYTDMNVGRLLQALETSEVRSNTIVLFWGDHGWSFGEKKHWRKFALWEEPTRTPLIWVAPGVTRTGVICESPVDLMSIYPTLCELANIPVPKYVEGPSAVSLLRDPKANWSTPSITTQGYKNHTVRTREWRYIRYADGSEELYNEMNDPYEWTNLVSKADTKEIRRKLAAMLPAQNKAPRKGGRPTED